jgi:hypothetical protein
MMSDTPDDEDVDPEHVTDPYDPDDVDEDEW